MEVIYKFGSPAAFSEYDIESFLTLLKKQGKIENPVRWKIMRCRLLGAGFVEDNMVCIGAIKPRTFSDFTAAKANLPNLADLFDWEVGYFYTEPKYEGNKYSSGILDGLITHYGTGNLMASTEIREGNRMINSLQNRGFVENGNSWTSVKSSASLRLFLKYKHD